MELTFLGTGAANGYPALWCQCPNCNYAREYGGWNLRANACAVVDREILLDLSPGMFHAAARLGLDLSQAHALLLTHTHGDHYYPDHLLWRRGGTEFADLPPEEWVTKRATHCTPVPLLTVYGSRFVRECLALATEWAGGEACMEERFFMRFEPLEPGVRREGKGFAVTAVEGIHGPEKGFAFSYILERDGKTLLYALDTGGFEADQVEILCRYRYDCVVMEGTFGLCTEADSGHMNTEKCRAWKRFFDERQLWRGQPRFVLSHLAPHWTPPHDVYAPQMAQEGILVAYDGLTLHL